MIGATEQSAVRENDRRMLIFLTVFLCLLLVVILVIAAVMLSLITSRNDDEAKVTKLVAAVQGKPKQVMTRYLII